MFQQTFLHTVRCTLSAVAIAVLLAACGGGGRGDGGDASANLPQVTATQRLASDTNFGNQGSTSLPLGTTNGAIVGVRLQSDGKVLVAGWRQTGLAPGGGVSGGPPREILLWRLTTSGTLDTSFGTGGVTTLNFDGSDRLSDFALQIDGRIVVASASTEPCANTGFGPPGSWICANATGVITTPKTVIARLMGNGALDPSFGERGRVNLTVGATWNWAPQVAVQTDQKLLVLSQEEYPTARILNWRLLRLSTDGSADPTFNQGTAVTARCGVGGNALAVTPGGRILVAGSDTASYVDPTANPGSCIEAFQPDGQVDSSFNAGQPFRALAQNNGRVNALRVLDDGRTVMTGNGADASGNFFFSLRLTAIGAADMGYGTGGLARSAVPNDRYNASSATLAAPDGTVVMTGSTWPRTGTGVPEPNWLRWTSAGRADEAFGASGFYMPGGTDAPVALLRDTAGRWLTVRLTSATNGQRSVIVSRLLGETAQP